MDRIMGVLTLKAPTYREIAEDPNATTTAGIIVVVFALIGGILNALIGGLVGAPAGNILATALYVVIAAIVGWFVVSWVMAFVAKSFFGGKTSTGEMLRVFGYANVFQILNIIPICGTIIGFVLSIIAAVIGIREASEVSTGKAIAIGIVGIIAYFIVAFIVGAVLGLVGLAPPALIPATTVPQ
jgi:hypothetical protein